MKFTSGGRSFKLGVSIGGVPSSDGKLSVPQILGAADASCYKAKRSGRNRVHFYNAKEEPDRRHYG
jgi:GGDEF domain-containing protein